MLKSFKEDSLDKHLKLATATFIKILKYIRKQLLTDNTQSKIIEKHLVKNKNKMCIKTI